IQSLEDEIMQNRRTFAAKQTSQQTGQTGQNGQQTGQQGSQQTSQQNRGAFRPPITAQQWDAVAEPALAEMRHQIQSSGDRLVDRATPIATGVIIRLALAGGLGLIAVIASIIVSITTARALVRQLERLRNAAWELAEQRLPGVVERLGHGEKVDVALEAPPLRFGSDEIGQVGRAFNAVQETAIRTAVEQAEL
ncbi:cell wall metabolism sensor histidine kinase WalK, partial [Micromonospora aurantiaca]|nr:cell wall metabolism sensor histidine kinase WalK [Micromonospora aurantiaca]